MVSTPHRQADTDKLTEPKALHSYLQALLISFVCVGAFLMLIAADKWEYSEYSNPTNPIPRFLSMVGGSDAPTTVAHAPLLSISKQQQRLPSFISTINTFFFFFLLERACVCLCKRASLSVSICVCIYIHTTDFHGFWAHISLFQMTVHIYFRMQATVQGQTHVNCCAGVNKEKDKDVQNNSFLTPLSHNQPKWQLHRLFWSLSQVGNGGSLPWQRWQNPHCRVEIHTHVGHTHTLGSGLCDEFTSSWLEVKRAVRGGCHFKGITNHWVHPVQRHGSR